MSKRMPAGNSLDGWMQQIWANARLRHGLARTAGALSALAPALVLANPSGGQVVAGSASIGNAGSNGVIVNQNSLRAVINWQQFSIGSNQYVQFIQPDSSAVVLNRVTGSNPSSIFGEIKANGQVFLINPNGILFAPGSTLDVSSLTASTLDISDSDFMASRYVFSKDAGAPDATVVNQGNVTVTAGGYVVLAGDYVENDGVIQAQSGKVLLAAGGSATLTMDGNGGLISYKIDAPTLARLAGVNNAGSIVANGGVVVMTTDVANALTATAVNNSGFITAHSVSQQGGEIVLLSEGGGIENSGTLDASASQAGVAGGTVVLRGNGHTELTPTSVIDATGDGANGGFIELSGHTLSVKGEVDPGRGGSLLIDPSEIKIVANGTDNDGSGGIDSVGTSFIAGQLNAHHNVTLVASQSIHRVSGSHISATVVGGGDLRLYIGTVPTGGSCGFGGICVGAGVPSISIRTFGTIDVSGLTINIKGAFIASASRGNVTTGDITAKAVSINGSTITTGNLVTNGTRNGYAVSLTAEESASVDSIHAGNITATGGKVFVDQGGSTFGRLVVGKITATGQSVSIHGAIGTMSVGSITAKAADVTHTGGGALTVVTLGKITTTGAFASTTGSVNGEAVHIDVQQATLTMHSGAKITAPGGGVIIKGANLNLGSVSAAGNLTISAHHGGSPAATVTATNLTGRLVDILASAAGYGGVVHINNVTATAGAITITAQGAAIGGSNVVTAGTLNASAGSVDVTATKITTGAITAGDSVHLNAPGSHSAASITVNGAIHAHSNISLDAHGSQGGDIKVTGVIVSTAGNVLVKADNTRGASGGDISVGNISAGGSVTIFSRGGGTATPVLNIGTITAGSEASINVQFLGSTAPVTVQTGAISAAAINIQVKGHGAKFTAPSLKAFGPSSAGTVECGCHTGFITGLVSGSHHSASFNVTGSVKSVSGNIAITAGGGVNSPGGGAISTGNISAGLSVILKGNDIQVGSITANSFVSIIGNSHSAVAHITATGLVKGSGIFIDANGHPTGYGSFGGSIDLAGGASATGMAGGSVSAGEVGIHIVAKTTSTVKMNIITGALQAAGGSISVIQQGGRGGVTVNGAVNASNGDVDIETHGTGSLNGGSISVGSITALHGAVTLKALNPGGRGANITVNGGINAGNIDIATSASTGGSITVAGALTAVAGDIDVIANSSGGRGGSGGNINVGGATKAMNGSVSFFARGSADSGGNITVHKVTAGNGVHISGSNVGSTESEQVQTGNITGEYVLISATGRAPIINTGTLTATGLVSSAGAHDYVKVLLSPIIATRGQGSISIGTVTGNGDVSIQALGGAVNTAAITGGDIDVSGSTIHVGGAITALGGSVCLTGSSVSSHATNIKVTGTIKAGMVQVKASPGSTAVHGASVDLGKVSSSLSGGIMIEAQTTAAVKTQITVGSMHAGGTGHIDVTQQGASGGIVINGPITTVNGGVTLTASGGSLSAHAITAGGQIRLLDTASHGGGITVGGNLTGTSVSIDAGNHAGANITVNGKILSSGDVNITANAGANNGGNIKVTGLISASSGNVTVQATGGGAAGGRIQLGSVSAAGHSNSGQISITGTYTGTAAGFTMKLGRVTGRYINVSMTGKDPVMTVDGFKATGSSGHSCECAHGYVNVQLHPTGDSGSMSITGAINTAHGDVRLSASHGVINLGNNAIITGSSGNSHSSGGSGYVSVQGGRIHLGNINAAGHISVAAAAVGSHAGSITAGPTDLWTGKYVNVDLTDSGGTKGKIAIGAVTATGTVGSSSQSHGGKLSIDASLSSKKVTVTTGTLTAATSLDVQIQNASGSAALGNLNSLIVKVSLANGNLTVGQLVHAGASITASNGSITDTTTGSLDLLRDTFHTTHGVHLKAGTNITLTGDSFGSGGLSASAGNKLVENSANPLDLTGQVLKAKQLILSANTIDLGGAKLTASSIQLSATSINNASAHGSITAAAGKIHATHGIILVGENIVVSGAGPLISAASVDIDKAVVTGTGVLSVNATGNLDASSLHVTAGGFTAHGGSVGLTGATITATKAVTIKSATDVNISGAHIAGSAVGISAARNITDGSGSAGVLTGGAGGLTLKITGKVQLAGETLTVGAVSGFISAASVDLDGAKVSGTGGLGIKTSGDLLASNLAVTAGSLAVIAGHDADLIGAQIDTPKAVSIDAAHDVNISDAQIVGSAVAIVGGVEILNGTHAGTIIAGAGGLMLKSKGDVHLSGETINIGTVTGLISAADSLGLAGVVFNGTATATFQAGTDIILTGAKLFLPGASMDAVGGSIDLTGLVAGVGGQLKLQAKHNIILSGVNITAGIFVASASGTIHNGGAVGTITAKAIKVDAKQDINLSSTAISIGSGALTGVTGDTTLLQLLAAAGLKPGSATPNGAFLAGGSLTLGTLDITGNYLVLQGSSISMLGPVTAPASGLLVEVRPTDPTASIGVDGQPATGQAFNISNQAFFALFPGDTIVIGDDAESGDVLIGSNGPFTLAGGTNLLFDTTGTITGLGKITGSGLVGSLETVAAAAGDNNVVTAGEIDPSTTTTSLGDQTDKKHLGGNQNGANGEGQGGTISLDTGTSSVCH